MILARPETGCEIVPSLCLLDLNLENRPVAAGPPILGHLEVEVGESGRCLECASWIWAYPVEKQKQLLDAEPTEGEQS